MTAPRNAEEPRRDLREACLREAKEAIRENGVDALSLRDVARRLKVSHQAPYKHFASKDHLLAEVISRCLNEFATTLRQSGLSQSGSALPPDAAMRRLGHAYLDYAARHPLEYRLMFMTDWPTEAKQLGLAQDARAAFDVLGERLAAVKEYEDTVARDRDAMYVWSTIHGIASILRSEAMQYLSFDDAEIPATVEHGMALIDRAIGWGDGTR